MRAFVRSGARAKAVDVFRSIGSSYIFGYYCDAIPAWAQAFVCGWNMLENTSNRAVFRAILCSAK